MNNQISIVIPAYKAEKFILRTIDSVLTQKGVEVEILVIEDGVFDNTREKLQNYKDKITLITLEKNMGAQVARNKGLELCKSDYVLFLDADDFFAGENFLSGLYESMVQHQSDVVFGNCVTKSETTNEKKYFIAPKIIRPHEVLLHRLTGFPSPAPCSILWKKNSLQNIGGWNEEYVKAQDVELIIRSVINGFKISTSLVDQAVYWQHDEERTSRRMDLEAFNSHEKLYHFIKNNIQGFSYETKITYGLNYYCAHLVFLSIKAKNNEMLMRWYQRWRRIPPKLSMIQYHGKKIFFLHMMYFIFGIENTRKLIDIVKRVR